MHFRDRHDAGRRLAERLVDYELSAPVVLALPRGGVPVGYEVARALGVPLDVVVARKIGAPGRPELGLGAIAEGGSPVLDDELLAALGLTAADLEATVTRERAELERRVRHYRGDRPPPAVRGRTVVVVDDGLATSGTARATLRALRSREPQRLVLAVPVAAAATAERLREDADDVVCVLTPQDFVAVGRWYDDFAQTSDDTVVELLERARWPIGPGP